MTIRFKIMVFSFMGFISTSMADTTFFKHNAVSITGISNPFGYKISINQKKEAKLFPSVNILDQNIDVLYLSSKSSKTNEIGKPIWSFITAQLPITENECSEANSAICYKKEDDNYCYQHCLMDTPNIVAFDEKANKLYFMQGTIMIGTGGGPAFLFMADINKKELKLLHDEWYQEKGSLSPSGRYLVISGNSIMKLYDTKNYHRSELNKTENNYDKNNNIRHGLYVKKWLSNTQFMYVDIARYFVRPIPENGEPFFSAKEVVYDVVSRKILSQHQITKEQADAYEKIL